MTIGIRGAMIAWCWFVVAFGAVLVAASQSDPFAATMFALFGHPEPVPTSPHLTFALALLGAVTIGWGLTILAVARADVPVNVWKDITLALLVWFVIDSGLSISTGFWRNAVSNSLLLIAYLFIRSRITKREG